MHAAALQHRSGWFLQRCRLISMDLEQPIGDWKNLCILAAHNNLIHLNGDFEFTMDDYVEWLQQERDVDSPLQTTTDLECEGENHISCDGNIVTDGDLFRDGDILCSGDIVCNSMIESTGQILCAGSRGGSNSIP